MSNEKRQEMQPVAQESERILAWKVARELTPEEIAQVSGMGTCSGGCCDDCGYVK
jgi:hypothetical protein